MGDDNIVVIPHEITDTPGSFEMALRGENADNGRVLTSTSVSVTVSDSMFTSDDEIGEPQSPTPSILSQILSSEESRVAAETARVQAESTRVEAEASRTSAESLRVTAETARETYWDTNKPLIEQAISDVENAVELAEDAANSVNDAVASANAAATNANSAAEAARNNILIGDTGYQNIVQINDAYSTIPKEIRVKGKTVQNLWVNPEGTDNGITLVSNYDGSFSISGTLTGSGSMYVTVPIYLIKPNTNYSFSITDIINGAYGAFINFMTGDNQEVYYIGGSKNSNMTSTFTSPESWDTCYCGVGLASGSTVSGTYRAMLVEGNKPSDVFVPSGIYSAGEILDYQKNLWSNPKGSSNGVTVISNLDGSFSISGIASEDVFLDVESDAIKPGLTYTVSIDNYPTWCSTDSSGIRIQMFDSSDSFISQKNG